MVIPEVNNSQEFVTTEFHNSIDTNNQFSINGFGFQTIRVHPTQRFKEISFEATFNLIKKDVNPFEFATTASAEADYSKIEEVSFKVDFYTYLGKTHFTSLPSKHVGTYIFDKQRSIFENLQDLNNWTYLQIYFKTGVTDVTTVLNEILENRHGVCQDFSHLFCALAKQNGIPARYVSGYLHQGNGYFGDSQMHAWAEAFVPDVGWVGFDPTNNLLASTNHIKVCHGRDYTDCAPIKGVVLSTGSNETKHSVWVSGEQQQ